MGDIQHGLQKRLEVQYMFKRSETRRSMNTVELRVYVRCLQAEDGIRRVALADDPWKLLQY